MRKLLFAGLLALASLSACVWLNTSSEDEPGPEAYICKLDLDPLEDELRIDHVLYSASFVFL